MSGDGHCDTADLYGLPDGGAVLVLGDDVAHVHLDAADCRSLAEALIEAAGAARSDSAPPPARRRARPRRRRRR